MLDIQLVIIIIFSSLKLFELIIYKLFDYFYKLSLGRYFLLERLNESITQKN